MNCPLSNINSNPQSYVVNANEIGAALAHANIGSAKNARKNNQLKKEHKEVCLGNQSEGGELFKREHSKSRKMLKKSKIGNLSGNRSKSELKQTHSGLGFMVSESNLSKNNALSDTLGGTGKVNKLNKQVQQNRRSNKKLQSVYSNKRDLNLTQKNYKTQIQQNKVYQVQRLADKRHKGSEDLNFDSKRKKLSESNNFFLSGENSGNSSFSATSGQISGSSFLQKKNSFHKNLSKGDLLQPMNKMNSDHRINKSETECRNLSEFHKSIPFKNPLKKPKLLEDNLQSKSYANSTNLSVLNSSDLSGLNISAITNLSNVLIGANATGGLNRSLNKSKDLTSNLNLSSFHLPNTSFANLMKETEETGLKLNRLENEIIEENTTTRKENEKDSSFTTEICLKQEEDGSKNESDISLAEIGGGSTNSNMKLDLQRGPLNTRNSKLSEISISSPATKKEQQKGNKAKTKEKEKVCSREERHEYKKKRSVGDNTEEDDSDRFNSSLKYIKRKKQTLEEMHAVFVLFHQKNKNILSNVERQRRTLLLTNSHSDHNKDKDNDRNYHNQASPSKDINHQDKELTHSRRDNLLNRSNRSRLDSSFTNQFPTIMSCESEDLE